MQAEIAEANAGLVDCTSKATGEAAEAAEDDGCEAVALLLSTEQRGSRRGRALRISGG